MSEYFTTEKLDTGYTQVPHGLWTLDLDHGAKCLLGWLHSHAMEYLAGLSVSRCEAEFGGGGSVRRWLAELALAGFLTKDKVGNRWRITLLAEPWLALHRRRGRPAESAPAESAPLPDPPDPPKRRGKPAETAPIENQGENQRTDVPVPSEPPRRPVATASGARPERDALFQAIVGACGMDYDEMTERQRKSCAVAMAELAKVGAKPDDVRHRAAVYRQMFPATLTPNALTNQWAMLRAAPPPVAAQQKESPGAVGMRKALETLRQAELPTDNVVSILRTGT